MIGFLNVFRGMGLGAILLRVVLSVACGMAIGVERSMKNRPAGIRTHVLICLGAAVASTTGLYVVLVLKLPADVTRISAQILTGLGFIGAGTIIITKKQSIKGLTTAAGLWATGIVGIAVGSGYYELALIGTALVVLTETVLGKLKGPDKGRPEFDVMIEYKDKDSLDRVLRMCKDNQMQVENIRIKKAENDDEGIYNAFVTLRGYRKSMEIVNMIAAIEGIIAAEEIWLDV